MRNVLIIGDSISLGYTPEVSRILDGRARVSHSPGNAQYSSYGLRHLKSWLGGDRWDAIHFNFTAEGYRYLGQRVTSVIAGSLGLSAGL